MNTRDHSWGAAAPQYGAWAALAHHQLQFLLKSVYFTNTNRSHPAPHISNKLVSGERAGAGEMPVLGG